MDKLRVICVIGVVLALTAPLAYGWDTQVDMQVVEPGDYSYPLVDCMEYIESWDGMMIGWPPSAVTNWRFVDRVGFRILQQYPSGGSEPNMTGFGFTYSTMELMSDLGPPIYAQMVAVEDPRDPFHGYYGRFWGWDEQRNPFEGTLKFREESETGEPFNKTLLGEGQLVVYQGEEIYGQPLRLQGQRTNWDEIVYEDQERIILSGYDMRLQGAVNGFVNGPAWIDATAYQLNPQYVWQFLQPMDGGMIAKGAIRDDVNPRRDLGEIDLWAVLQREFLEEPLDYVDGMIITSQDNYPEATLAGLLDSLLEDPVFAGLLEHLWVHPGDLSGDGFVGGADLDTVRAYWGTHPLVDGLTFGDPSRDGFVGGADLDMVRAHWGEFAAVVPPSTPVPEPSTLAGLMALGLVGVLTARRRR